VPEPELAEKFGISRTPIREAFRQLESEGFITFTPRKGAVVSPITEKDVKEFYAIKGMLEGYAAKMACCKLSGEDLKRMEYLNSQMAKCAERNDVQNFFKLDNHYHDVFFLYLPFRFLFPVKKVTSHYNCGDFSLPVWCQL